MIASSCSAFSGVHGGAIGEGHAVETGAEELDELLDHTLLAQGLGDGEDHVGGGDAFAQAARELHADDLRGHHVERLAEHRRLGFDAAHTPAEDAEAVDHGGMRVGAHAAVGVGGQLAVLFPELDHRRQVLEVHLVHDAGPRRHRPEVPEGPLGELEQLVPLPIPAILEVHVPLVRVRGAGVVHLDRMVDHQVTGHHRVDAVGIPPHPGHGVAHRRQVHHARDAGEVLQHYPRRHPRQLPRAAPAPCPGAERRHMFLRHHPPSREAQGVLQQDANREGKPVQVSHALALKLRKAENRGGLGAQRQGAAGAEGVDGGGHGSGGWKVRTDAAQV